MKSRRPRLAYPFSVLTETGTVRLVAGEDQRYTLSGPNLEHWLPELLLKMNGGTALDALLAQFPEEQRAQAIAIVERLYGERVLVDGPALSAHGAHRYAPEISGRGDLANRLRASIRAQPGTSSLTLLCQDDLDYAEALRVHRGARRDGTPFLWASHGALTRAYVSPLFLPDAGPCFACLLRGFRRLSPVPEILDALAAPEVADRRFHAVEFPPEGLDVLHGLVAWKLSQAELEQPSAGLYRLHVLERDSMEVSSHRVLVDPECPDCRRNRP